MSESAEAPKPLVGTFALLAAHVFMALIRNQLYGQVRRALPVSTGSASGKLSKFEGSWRAACGAKNDRKLPLEPGLEAPFRLSSLRLSARARSDFQGRDRARSRILQCAHQLEATPRSRPRLVRCVLSGGDARWPQWPCARCGSCRQVQPGGWVLAGFRNRSRAETRHWLCGG